MSKIKFSKKTLNEIESDVLFSYTNTDFAPVSGGVLQTLFTLDSGLIAECAHANLKPGTAILLGPASLSYKAICHFAISGIGNDPTESSIRSAMRWGFQLVSDHRYSSYVFPALNEDSGGMPIAMAAEIMLREVLVFAENPFVETVTIQCKNAKEYSEYRAALKTLVK